MLKKQETFEGEPERREPLHDKVLAHMMELSEENHGLSFRQAAWLWTKLGWYKGYHRQEFAMEKDKEIQVYMKPVGTQVVQVFTLGDFIFMIKTVW